MAEYSTIQTIKRRFFAMRNGIIADTLRKGGLDYKMIFGLNLPQIAEIAADLPHDANLAEELWADRRTRESMLLAPMLYPPEKMDPATASRWMEEAPTVEVADILCHRLLRYVDKSVAIAINGISKGSDMARYTSLRLMLNLLGISSTQAGRGIGLPQPGNLAEMLRPFVEAELSTDTQLTRPIAAQALDEIEFLTE